MLTGLIKIVLIYAANALVVVVVAFHSDIGHYLAKLLGL